MEIVIKIDDERYKDIQRIAEVQLDRGRFQTAEQVIANGIPLPKRHGNLIDENELLEITKSYKSELGRLKVDPFVKSGIETVERFIKEMSPIIEADKDGDAE